MEKRVIDKLASKYKIEPNVLRSVIAIESAGSGFNSNGTIKIQFEPHHFVRRYMELNPNEKDSIKYNRVGSSIHVQMKYGVLPDNVKSNYSKLVDEQVINSLEKGIHTTQDDIWVLVIINGVQSQSFEYVVYEESSKISSKATMMATSFGLGQVLGKWWKELGFKSVEDFVSYNKQSEENQLDCMLRYISNFNLIVHLQNKDWARFARGYNGPSFKKFNYDTKLNNHYNSLK